MDYTFNPEIMAQWVFGYKSHVILDRLLELKYFQAAKNNLAQITLKLTESMDEDYIQGVKNLGVPVELFSPDDKHLIDTRIKFLDWDVEALNFPEKKELDFIDEICDTTYYKSSKTLLSHGKVYASKAAWEQGQSTIKTEKILDTDSFWEESQYFRIYNKG